MLPTDHGFPAHNSQYSDTAESARRGERQCWAEGIMVVWQFDGLAVMRGG